MVRHQGNKGDTGETGSLFPDFVEDTPTAQDIERRLLVAPAPRLRQPVREQVFLRPVSLEELIGDDHQARVVWACVEELDLSALYRRIKAVEGHAGRAATDPKVFLALWLLATLDGVGSARTLERMCRESAAYQWMCGGIGVNYHTLADFRVEHEEVLEELLSQGVAALMAEGLVDLKRVAQDGMRVRASAGSSSFRRGKTLKECLREARRQVRHLREEIEHDPAGTNRRQQAARERTATERLERVRKALRRLPEQTAKKKPKEKETARASTTDAEATVMKMADGGFRPAYNLQLATDTKTQVIVGVDVSTSGSDQGQMAPMVKQLKERYQRAPHQILVDGGFIKKEDIERVAAPDLGCIVFAPVAKPRVEGIDPFAPKPEDSKVIAEWRQRMGTEEAKQIYKERAATAECVNALARNRGLQRLPVRGRRKVRAVALLFALAHNLLRTVALRALVAQPA